MPVRKQVKPGVDQPPGLTPGGFAGAGGEMPQPAETVSLTTPTLAGAGQSQPPRRFALGGQGLTAKGVNPPEQVVGDGGVAGPRILVPHGQARRRRSAQGQGVGAAGKKAGGDAAPEAADAPAAESPAADAPTSEAPTAEAPAAEKPADGGEAPETKDT